MSLNDRILKAFRSLVQAEFPKYAYMGIWEYSIDSTDGETADITPTSSFGLPSLAAVPLKSPITGATATPTVGKRCLVGFINSDPGRPYIISCDGLADTVEVNASSVVKLGGGGPYVARKGDSITLGYFIWDPTIFTLYISPAILGPLLTVYTVWGVFPAGTNLAGPFPIPPPTPGVPPTPGSPGTSWSGLINGSGTMVTCG